MATLEKDELQQMDVKELQQLDGRLQDLDELQNIELSNETARLQSEIAQLKLEKDVAATKEELLEAENARLNKINAEMKATIDQQGMEISNLEKKQSTDVDMKVMQAKIDALESESEDEFKVQDREKKSSLFMFVEKMQSIVRYSFTAISSLANKQITSFKNPTIDPNVIVKLIKPKNSLSFLAYSTLDDNEKPRKIEMKWLNSFLFINGAWCYSKKLVLDGTVSFFDADPFHGNAGAYTEDYDQNSEYRILSKLLKYVLTCNINELLLFKQMISMKDYEKLASSGTIKNLFFTCVTIKDEDGAFVQLEDIMEKLPNIEKFGYDIAGNDSFFILSNVFSVNKGTFKKLVKLPSFKNLKIFELFNIVIDEFDADGFLDFMTKHPDTEFTLSFCYLKCGGINKLKAVTEKLFQSCPFPRQLNIKCN